MENKKYSTVKMRFTCAIIFIVFTYLFLSCYQENVLAMAQHVLSGGMTDYSYGIAPVLITLILFLLQLGVFAVTRVKRRFHGLTYFPSMLVLVFITHVPNNISECHSLGAWWWLIPLLLILWAGAMWVVMQLEPMEQELHSNSWLSKMTWLNLLQLLVMMFVTIMVTNSDRLIHQRLKMEHLMKNRQYEQALEVAKKQQETDSSLTMLRIACLHETGKMGEKLFTYPLVGGSEAMMPNGTSVKALMWQPPVWLKKPSPWMVKHHKKYRITSDYKLCALLLDKKIDQFAHEITKYYKIDSVALPRHYREALVLYTHRRTNPIVVYHNTVMETDFQDYQTLEHKYPGFKERQAAIRDTYGNTYWYYYQYGNK